MADIGQTNIVQAVRDLKGRGQRDGRPRELTVRWCMPQEPETTLDTIRHLKRQEPFVPFRIMMTSGDGYVIEDPDALAISSSQLHYYPPRVPRAVHLRLNQITAVEENEKPAA